MGPGGPLERAPFGGDLPGDDRASFLNSMAFERRHRDGSPKLACREFEIRQYLFSRQAEVMRGQSRHDDLVDRSLRFVQEFVQVGQRRTCWFVSKYPSFAVLGMQVLSRKEEEGLLRPHLREAWTMSASLLLVEQLPWLGRRGSRATGEITGLARALETGLEGLPAAQLLLRLLGGASASAASVESPGLQQRRNPSLERAGSATGGRERSWGLDLEYLKGQRLQRLTNATAEEAKQVAAAALQAPGKAH